MADRILPIGEIVIPVTVSVELDSTTGKWLVAAVIDERTGDCLGDIGVYEFDGETDFPGVIMRSVLSTFEEIDEFEPSVFYSVEVTIMAGGGEIGSASRYFYGPYVED